LMLLASLKEQPSFLSMKPKNQPKDAKY